MSKFRSLSLAQEVTFAPGAIDRLGEIIEPFRWQRFMLCASPAVKNGGQVKALQAALGDRLVGVYDTVRPHVQDIQVDEARALAAARGIDALIGMGGGSSIGMAKAVSFELEKAHAEDGARPPSPFAQPLVPVIAIPTTYAGSEMTAVYGVTHSREVPPRKVTVSDPRVAPRLVIYDPQLTLGLSPEMTASTGMNALAHCIEALYSITRHPLSTAAAAGGIQHIAQSLLRCCRQRDDLEARSVMLTGAYLAGFSLANVSMGLHHGICHVLGGTANVPHGIANAIILPYAIRFNNAGETARLLLPAAEAMGIPVEGIPPERAVASLAQKISDLTQEMGLPQGLREVGVREADLPYLAQMAFESKTVRSNPRPARSAVDIEALLRDAW